LETCKINSLNQQIKRERKEKWKIRYRGKKKRIKKNVNKKRINKRKSFDLKKVFEKV